MLPNAGGVGLSRTCNGPEIMGHKRRARKSFKMTGGLPQNTGKKWQGLDVDLELKDDWLGRMNAIPGITVTGTCAGHPEVTPNPTRYLRQHILDFSRPFISFVIETDPRSFEPYLDAHGLARDVDAAMGDVAIVTTGIIQGSGYYHRNVPLVMIQLKPERTRAEMSDAEFAQWWETVLIRLESIFMEG